MSFTLYHADCIGQPGNCLYPHQVLVSDAESLKRAVGCDYVCALYENGYRSNENFRQMDCIGLDCDNTHSEDPTDWVTPQMVQEAFPDMAFAVHYSRHNLKQKKRQGGASEIPLFSAYGCDYGRQGMCSLEAGGA